MQPNQIVTRHKFYLLGGAVFSLVIILMAATISVQRISFWGRASTGSSISGPALLSVENSYVFASPITALANNSAIIRVTVFLLNSQGLGISGQRLSLKTSNPLNISSTSPVTDSMGRATFDVTSSSPGHYTITAESQGVSLPQTVSVDFQ